MNHGWEDLASILAAPERPAEAPWSLQAAKPHGRSVCFTAVNRARHRAVGARRAADRRTGKVVTVAFVSAVWPGGEVSAGPCEWSAVALELQQFILRWLLGSGRGAVAVAAVSSWVKESWVLPE